MSEPWRLLLVEDDEDDFVLARALFAASGRDVDLQWVQSVEEALPLLAGHRFDAVLADYRLGAQSGLDLVREAARRGVDVPIILLTGQGNEDLDLQAMRAGAAEYLVKGELTATFLERTVRYAIERRRHEEALRRREESLRLFLERVPAIFWSTDAQLRFTSSLGAGLASLGLQPQQAVGQSMWDFFHTEDPGFPAIAAQRRALAGEAVSFEQAWSGRTYRCFVQPMEDGEERPRGAIGIALDVTDQERSEDRYRRLVEGLEDVVYEMEIGPDGELQLVYVSAAVERFGSTAQEVLGDPRRRFSLVHPDDVAGLLAARLRVVETGERVVRSYRVRSRDSGPWSWIEDRMLPRRGSDGRVLGFLGVARDISERREAEEALLRRDRILEAVARGTRRLLAADDLEAKMPDVLAALGGATAATAVTVFANARSAAGELIGQPRWCWKPARQHAALAPPAIAWVADGLRRWKHELAAGGAIHGALDALPDGEGRALAAAGVAAFAAVPLLVQKRFWGMLRFDTSSADHVWTQGELDAMRAAGDAVAAALRNHGDAALLREREDQLRQAQKMEAVGRLAGGIAHDFNNLLTAIIGYSELLHLRLDDDAARQECDEVLDAARRAAALTRQLLAFSRRQPLQPQPVDLGVAITALERLLRRLVGERVELVLEAPPGLPPALVDPSQLEQVVVNLAVNARDAMPEGGRLRLTVARREVGVHDDALEALLPNGTYVDLLVEDTGTGIPAAIRSKIFEPFFTTKANGKGTGLGLATVYGIVEQSGGTILVDSEEGRGTRFTVLLPSAPASG